MIGAAAAKAATPAASEPAQAKKLEELKQVAHQFEAVFLRQMISSMRSAKLADDIFGNDAGAQFRDMSDARLADSMAERNTLRIADMLVKQFAGRIAPAPTTDEAAK